MPHKHKRRKRDADETDYDLPPSSSAVALPVGKVSRRKVGKHNAAKTLNQTYSTSDDTPKAFMRLMRFQQGKNRPEGLDNGESGSGKKRKRGQGDTNNPISKSPNPAQNEVPRIKPGERASEFSARVNQAIPISGLSRRRQKGEDVTKFQTRTEKKIQKMQDAWRREEARLAEIEEDARDRAEEEDAEVWTAIGERKGRSTRGPGIDDSGDPWAPLKHSREQSKGLHDVAQAPPTFKRIPHEKFKVSNGAAVDVANVPTRSGSLRRREELGNARKSIIESYRKLMEGSRSYS